MAKAARSSGSTRRGRGWWDGSASPSPTGDQGRKRDPVKGRVAIFVMVLQGDTTDLETGLG